MQRRAEQIGDTRQRIVDATVRLHGTVGPSKTTIAAIAEEAGVTRLTVYRHFPDDVALFTACSTEWLSSQVLPDPARWASISDPMERLRDGLTDLYRFYRDGEEMLRHIRGEMESLPAAFRQDLVERDSMFCELLLAPFERRANRTLRAVIGHAISFWTWRSLYIDNGLTNNEAVEVMTGLVLLASGPSLLEERETT